MHDTLRCKPVDLRAKRYPTVHHLAVDLLKFISRTGHRRPMISAIRAIMRQTGHRSERQERSYGATVVGQGNAAVGIRLLKGEGKKVEICRVSTP